ncbi:MAG TPA: hypothetical protein VG167_20550 [Verrucomicrobiae bacterium]|nr:hypothetical protein [Verrucomicrobiae bacterium]
MNVFPSRPRAACVVLASSLLLAVLGSACSKQTPPPQVMTAEQLETALDHAFSSAKTDLRQLETDIVSALKTPDYSRAYLQLQKLSSQTGLNNQQNQVVASGLLSVNQLLQTAQTQGDTNASQVLHNYRATK